MKLSGSVRNRIGAKGLLSRRTAVDTKPLNSAAALPLRVSCDPSGQGIGRCGKPCAAGAMLSPWLRGARGLPSPLRWSRRTAERHHFVLGCSSCAGAAAKPTCRRKLMCSATCSQGASIRIPFVLGIGKFPSQSLLSQTKRGRCKITVSQRPLISPKRKRKAGRMWKTNHISPGFLKSKASPGTKTSAKSGKLILFSVKQPKSRTNAFAIALCHVSSRAFSGQKPAQGRIAPFGCFSSLA